MTHYKIVTCWQTSIHAAKLLTSLYPEPESKYLVVYKLNQWINPLPNTKLFAFDSLKNAKAFLKKYAKSFINTKEAFEIYECEVENSSKIETIALVEYSFDAFWDRVQKKQRLVESYTFAAPDYTFAAPEGSFVCDSIKLTKKVA